MLSGPASTQMVQERLTARSLAYTTVQTMLNVLHRKGKVKRKYVEDGRNLVEIEQEARNQDDELSVLGTGIVELPSRG